MTIVTCSAIIGAEDQRTRSICGDTMPCKTHPTTSQSSAVKRAYAVVIDDWDSMFSLASVEGEKSPYNFRLALRVAGFQPGDQVEIRPRVESGWHCSACGGAGDCDGEKNPLCRTAPMEPGAPLASSEKPSEIRPRVAPGEPLAMVLHCPKCGLQHLDAPEPEIGWTNPPHKSHLCHGCKSVWRPADVPTTGVQAVQQRGERDTWPDAEGIYRSPFAAAPEGQEAPRATHRCRAPGCGRLYGGENGQYFTLDGKEACRHHINDVEPIPDSISVAQEVPSALPPTHKCRRCSALWRYFVPDFQPPGCAHSIDCLEPLAPSPALLEEVVCDFDRWSHRKGPHRQTPACVDPRPAYPLAARTEQEKQLGEEGVQAPPVTLQPCAHGRLDYRTCPHCMGFAVGLPPSATFTLTQAEPVSAAPVDPALMVFCSWVDGHGGWPHPQSDNCIDPEPARVEPEKLGEDCCEVCWLPRSPGAPDTNYCRRRWVGSPSWQAQMDAECYRRGYERLLRAAPSAGPSTGKVD